MKKPNLSKKCVLCVVVVIMLAVAPLLCGCSNPTEPIDMSQYYIRYTVETDDNALVTIYKDGELYEYSFEDGLGTLGFNPTSTDTAYISVVFWNDSPDSLCFSGTSVKVQLCPKYLGGRFLLFYENDMSPQGNIAFSWNGEF